LAYYVNALSGNSNCRQAVILIVVTHILTKVDIGNNLTNNAIFDPLIRLCYKYNYKIIELNVGRDENYTKIIHVIEKRNKALLGHAKFDKFELYDMKLFHNKH
jgi:hypothetical protein